MKIFKHVKSKLYISLIISMLLIGIFIGYKIFMPNPKENKQWQLPNTNNNAIKFITEESLVNDIKEVNKLIPLELELSETITIDDSWGDWDIFKKYKKITYTADCSYSIDLTEMTSDNININSRNKKINIKIPKPTIYSIDINHDKTIYEEAVTGLLRFGDLTLSSEEYGIIEREIKSNISTNMKSDELYKKACSNAKDSMNNLLIGILGDNITVTIDLI